MAAASGCLYRYGQPTPNSIVLFRRLRERLEDNGSRRGCAILALGLPHRAAGFIFQLHFRTLHMDNIVACRGCRMQIIAFIFQGIGGKDHGE